MLECREGGPAAICLTGSRRPDCLSVLHPLGLSAVSPTRLGPPPRPRPTSITHRRNRVMPWIRIAVLGLVLLVWSPRARAAESAPPRVPAAASAEDLLEHLDAPLLFVKRHSYTGIHIYDTYYKWPPGGGGIYVLENPSAPRAAWKIRPVIDPSTPETLGIGVYSHPELSYDAKRLLFCFKGEPNGSTSIYEIGVDGRGLRRLTDPTPTCACYKGRFGGQHDLAPAYLADGRIVFLSTRSSGLVPCFDSGVAILHVMNADGSDLHSISVNNVNEFDPCLLPDGRILYGRWEYVDKNALTIQSLWTVNPDGTQETALFANNMVFPEAILDARPVPGSHLIVGTLAKHNGPPRGSIAFIDPHRGKNGAEALRNLEHLDQPTCDTGNSCEPWPISADVVLFSGRPAGARATRWRSSIAADAAPWFFPIRQSACTRPCSSSPARCRRPWPKWQSRGRTRGDSSCKTSIAASAA